MKNFLFNLVQMKIINYFEYIKSIDWYEYWENPEIDLEDDKNIFTGELKPDDIPDGFTG